MVFCWPKSKTSSAEFTLSVSCGANRGQTRTPLELAPQLLQFFLSRADGNSRTVSSSARHAWHFRLLCLQSRSATYSLRVFAFRHLLHVLFFAHTQPPPTSGTPCTSGRGVPNHDSTRTHHGYGLLHSGLHALGFELRPMQLWRRLCLVSHKLYNSCARHNLCMLDAASSAGPQVRKPPRISKVCSLAFKRYTHDSSCARHTACRSAARPCGSHCDSAEVVLDMHEPSSPCRHGTECAWPQWPPSPLAPLAKSSAADIMLLEARAAVNAMKRIETVVPRR